MKGEASVYPGTPKNGKADCTMTISDDDFVDLVSGKLNGQQVFIDKSSNDKNIKKDAFLSFVVCFI